MALAVCTVLNIQHTLTHRGATVCALLMPVLMVPVQGRIPPYHSYVTVPYGRM